ncbi:MAG: type II toxin-antitoxin system PemK/MazF family toxin [Acidimicrobiales bacterium]
MAPTSRSARAATFRPEVRVAGETTRVLVEQVGAIDARCVGERAGHLTRDEMWSVDEALADVLGLL